MRLNSFGIKNLRCIIYIYHQIMIYYKQFVNIWSGKFKKHFFEFFLLKKGLLQITSKQFPFLQSKKFRRNIYLLCWHFIWPLGWNMTKLFKKIDFHFFLFSQFCDFMLHFCAQKELHIFSLLYYFAGRIFSSKQATGYDTYQTLLFLLYYYYYY